MRRKREHDSSVDGPVLQELSLLTELERTPRTSQRDLARRIGTALKVTNLIMRELVRKGYMRARRAGWRSWVYTVTPAGFMRRTDLAGSYVFRLLGHFQRAKQLLEAELTAGGLHAESSVAILGTGELVELVYLSLKDLGVDHVDILGASTPDGPEMVAGVRVRPEDSLRLDGYDRVVLASLGDLEMEWRTLQEMGVPPEKVVTLFGSPSEHGQADGLERAVARRDA